MTPATSIVRRPRGRTAMNGEVVPPGTLKPNQYNRFAKMTPPRRWEAIVRECARVVAEQSRAAITTDADGARSKSSLTLHLDSHIVQTRT